jgi:hypothetical protein
MQKELLLQLRIKLKDKARLNVNSLPKVCCKGNQLIIDFALGKIYILRFYCSV